MVSEETNLQRKVIGKIRESFFKLLRKWSERNPMNNEQRMESPKTNNYYKLGKSNMGKENAYIIVIKITGRN